MTIAEARRIQRDFYENPNPPEDDAFLFMEAMDYIIQSTKDPHAMLSLGGYYYDKRNFDLPLTYIYDALYGFEVV